MFKIQSEFSVKSTTNIFFLQTTIIDLYKTIYAPVVTVYFRQGAALTMFSTNHTQVTMEI